MTMAEHPLLVFPEPARADRERRTGGGGRPRLPDHSQQAQRLALQFQQLQQAMERKRATLRDNPMGVQPEQVLVLETVGSIDNFITAIRRIDGLDWLGEFELDAIDPDYGFRDESNPEKQLRGQLFLVMTNQRALREMQNLFNEWQRDPSVKFPYGLAKLRSAFSHLYNIRPWSEEDRIRETGLLEDWEYLLDSDESVVPFEAELWFRADPNRQQQAESYLRGIIESLDGEIIQQCVINDIGYHSVLGSVPRTHIPDLLNMVTQIQESQVQEPQIVRLLRCEAVMYIRPVGQCATPIPEDAPGTDTLEETESQDAAPLGEPIVALFDGMPLTGHQLLNAWLSVDDPDGYESAYQAYERFHGTTMGSLICHGDLGEGGGAITRQVYVRPIMKPQPSLRGQPNESIPPDVLPVDLIHRAVRRLYESENGELPAAPNVRVINLSIGDHARPLNREMSPLARLLDWLAWKYNVLFIVSAGNHRHDIVLEISGSTPKNLSPDKRQDAIIVAIAADTRNRRLLSPAESLNGLTVGAVHADASSPEQHPNTIDPFVQTDIPSVVSAHGPGYRRAIKPDFLLHGGRQFLYESPVNAGPKSILSLDQSYRPPGQRVAVPGTVGLLGQTSHTRGTSNATALASRGANFLYDVIEQLRREPNANLSVEYDAILIKTLLTHGASWTNLFPLYKSVLGNNSNGRVFRDYLGRFLGYGSTDLQRVISCTDQRVTLLGVGELGDGDGHEFTLPLPPGLSSVTHKRRLTVTLTWLTPVDFRRQNYRVAHLWFNPKNRITPNRQFADHRAVQRGTVQHEVLEGDKAEPFQDGDNIVIKVNCRSDAGDITEPIRYGLAVTLEVAESLNIPIYQEVRDRLAVPVPVPV